MSLETSVSERGEKDVRDCVFVVMKLLLVCGVRNWSLMVGALNRFKERKPETNEILTGTEPEPETKSNFIVPNRTKKFKWPLTG